MESSNAEEDPGVIVESKSDTHLQWDASAKSVAFTRHRVIEQKVNFFAYCSVALTP